MTKNTKLSDQQYQLMSVLWNIGEGSAKTVQSGLEDVTLAHTTIATILTRLEKKGVLTSRTEGRERIFTPRISENEAQKSMISSLVGTLFKGDDRQLLAHLVKENEIDDAELNAIQQILNNKTVTGESND
ncbi:BlaI/MecI/CopY family transcriptional regulator [Kordiimonas aquimaris]|uniref:BlaI/MecI/CopY family transcriptional regulator n=1 Tax=Kordiimonas aquimaris TaxID=707591 RepID=UPI0021D25C7E|nr:BlaI/MecI/CopY family transcriptional regulator [Kordiimonas aquimaris]